MSQAPPFEPAPDRSAQRPPGALSHDQVRRVAALARLSLTDEQVRRFAGELSSILGYVERLGAADLRDVEPMASPLDATPPLRDDEPGPVLPLDTLMALAPQADPPFVRIPRVLGEGGGA
jgi:aspartyl-tRNA(Asn)/glutamyl-tRNA(Gln) amidotransferase subunit C